MHGSKHIFLLGLGLCLVASYVNSASVKVYGSDPKNPYEDVTRQLEKERAEKQKLETLLEKTTDMKQKGRLQKDLDKVISGIAKKEVTFRVIYRDHIDAIEAKTKDYQNEKAKMQNELNEAEQQHAKAVADMKSANQKDKQQISAYQAKLEDSAKQVERLHREYEALQELQAEKEERQKQEKEQLVHVKNELTKKLEEAQRLHTKAVEVMSMSLESPGSKPASIPLQNDIEAWKNLLAKLTKMPNKQRKLEGLFKAQEALKELHKKLFEKSDLSPTASIKDLEEALAVMKSNTKTSKGDLTNKRSALLEKLKQKALGDYNEQEIDELKKVNEQLQGADMFLKEIARRKAYLKSIKEIDALMKACKDAASKA